MSKKRPCVKKAFETKEAAIVRLAEIALNKTVTGKKPVRSYRCPFCKNWHLTSIPRNQFKKKSPATTPTQLSKDRIHQLAAHIIKKKRWDKE